MGSALVNVIKSELENVILQTLIESGKLKVYLGYVDGSLLLGKVDDIKHIFDNFNSFDKNLKFKMDGFEDNNNVHFLDRTIDKIDTDLY